MGAAGLIVAKVLLAPERDGQGSRLTRRRRDEQLDAPGPTMSWPPPRSWCTNSGATTSPAKAMGPVFTSSATRRAGGFTPGTRQTSVTGVSISIPSNVSSDSSAWVDAQPSIRRTPLTTLVTTRDHRPRDHGELLQHDHTRTRSLPSRPRRRRYSSKLWRGVIVPSSSDGAPFFFEYSPATQVSDSGR